MENETIDQIVGKLNMLFRFNYGTNRKFMEQIECEFMKYWPLVSTALLFPVEIDSEEKLKKLKELDRYKREADLLRNALTFCSFKHPELMRFLNDTIVEADNIRGDL